MNKTFENDNYLIIKNAISEEFCLLLSEYINLKAKIKPVKRKDALKNVHREYGDPFLETILKRFTPIVEKATELELWPTLSFYYLYKNGHKLAKHTDRSSCEIVASLCIGADPAFKAEQPSWPLVLSDKGKAVPISVGYGDLLIFKGYKTEHWREPFTGEWFSSAIFGFVDKNGPLSFQKYDQRKELGLPHVGMFNWMFGNIKNSVKNKFLRS